jgi:16S rRNA A1518/A1519 N6-dimethyltransferase RsmA/KsgA/DIM1 with predicted DNA glycosylase/AP lyase activity
MEKSLDNLPVPKIQTSIVVNLESREEKKKEEKFSFLDKLLTKHFLNEYFKKKSK